jgi:hypothetical protein
LRRKSKWTEKSGILPYHPPQHLRTVRDVRRTERLDVPSSFALGNVEMSSDPGPAWINLPAIPTSVNERE